MAERSERLARAAAPHAIDTAGIAVDSLEFGLDRVRKLMGLKLHGRGSWRRRSSSFRRLAVGRRSLWRRRLVGRLCGRRRWSGDRGSFALFGRIRLPQQGSVTIWRVLTSEVFHLFVRHGCARLQLDIARQIVGRSRGLCAQAQQNQSQGKEGENVVHRDMALSPLARH